jgi:hypothetical protein
MGGGKTRSFSSNLMQCDWALSTSINPPSATFIPCGWDLFLS